MRRAGSKFGIDLGRKLIVVFWKGQEMSAEMNTVAEKLRFALAAA